MGSDSCDGPSWYRNRQRKVPIQNEEIESFLAKLSRREAPGREVAVLVASDAFVRQSNARYRGKNASTDVLSFPDGEDGRLGDILISAARAERQAREYGHSVETEIKTLILHGFLHLSGYDHETDEGEMRAEERRLRRKYGLGRGLIERVESC
ncbi:MAG: rRNA maturation RNase YbeY [Bryobacterales bacterium]